MARQTARSSKVGGGRFSLSDQTGGDPSYYLVLLRSGASAKGLAEMLNISGVSIKLDSRESFPGALSLSNVGVSNGVLFGNLDVAVVNVGGEQYDRLQRVAGAESQILAIEPMRSVEAFTAQLSDEYYRGYRDGLAKFIEYYDYKNHGAGTFGETLEYEFQDDGYLTWGLKATRVDSSPYNGQGVRIAILDTGMDESHIDFSDRSRTACSFVAGETPLDGHPDGHGTHCIGIALGPQQPQSGVRRYGCASEGGVVSAKVLSNSGGGTDFSILQGIDWALEEQCRVISMSLGAKPQEDGSYSQSFEAIAQRALNASPGALIVAAVGNGSKRPAPPAPACHPANCPSILAVGAISSKLEIAPFSNAGADIVAPGVEVFSASASTSGEQHRKLSGTSMSAPFVAGIAAMWFEACGQEADARKVLEMLKTNARRLNVPDVGVGLVQAPK